MRDTTEPTICLTAPSAAPNIERPQEIQDGNYSLGRGVAVLITTSRFRVAGIVQDIQPHALSILVTQPLPEGSASIEFGAVSRYGEIVSSQRKAGKYEVRVVTPSSNEYDLRSAERYPLTQEVQVHAASLQSPLVATVVDVSMHGVGLEMLQPLGRGEIITVESDSSVAFGIVRHCRSGADGRFQAGVEVFHIMPKES